MKLTWWSATALAALGFMVGCDEGRRLGELPIEGEGGEGTGGSGGAGGEGNAGTNQEAFDTLAECNDESACGSAGYSDGECQSFDMDATLCVLAALAEGTPGSYAFNWNECSADGNAHREQWFVVHDDGSVHVAGLYRAHGEFDEEYDEPRLCVLKPASYFEDCIDDLEAEGDWDPNDEALPEAYECGDGKSWVSGCAPAGASCGAG
jgi:hypothetical protein